MPQTTGPGFRAIPAQQHARALHPLPALLCVAFWAQLLFHSSVLIKAWAVGKCVKAPKHLSLGKGMKELKNPSVGEWLKRKMERCDQYKDEAEFY